MVSGLLSSRIITVVLLGLAAPCWLFLRSWYGYKTFFALVFATIFQIPIVFVCMAVVSVFEQSSGVATGVADGYFNSVLAWYPTYALLGGIVQLSIMLPYLIYTSANKQHRPLKGYAGSIIVWPSSYSEPPFDLLLLSAICLIFYFGYVGPDEVLAVVASVNNVIEALGLPSPPPPNPQFLNSSFLVPVVVYTLTVLLTWTHHGLLPTYDDGKRRVRPKSQREEKIAPTKIKNTADPASQELKHIFSRRHPQLAEMAKPTN